MIEATLSKGDYIESLEDRVDIKYALKRRKRMARSIFGVKYSRLAPEDQMHVQMMLKKVNKNLH